jgi:hypothetical protein
MARQRFIWPTFWDDPDLGELDEAARLLYIGCFSLADDEGRILGDPVYLKSAVFKYRTDITPDRVRELRDELERACRCFTVYIVRKIEYIAFTNWADFQKPKYPTPSRHPAPPKRRRSTPKPAPLSQTDSGNDSRNRSGTDSGSSSGNGSGNDSPTGRDGLGLESLTPPNPNPVVGTTSARPDKDDGRLAPAAPEFDKALAAAASSAHDDDLPF